MVTIPFTTSYKYSGEYYSPDILIKIFKHKRKYKILAPKGAFLWLPVKVILFSFCFLVSLALYPIYLINKLFFILNRMDYALLEFLLLIFNIFYLISYCIYKLVAAVHSLFCFIYCMIPPDVYVFQKKAVVNRDSYYY